MGAVFLLLLFFLPRESGFPYDYSRGSEWRYDNLYAQFDFSIYKTEDQLRKERADARDDLISYYRYSFDVADAVVDAVSDLDLGVIERAVKSELASIYDRGVIEFAEETNGELIYIQKDKRAEKYPVSEFYTVAMAKDKLLADLDVFDDMDMDSLLTHSGVYRLVVPNIFFDAQTTELVRSESDDAVSLTSGLIETGTLIVSKGEIVTSDVEIILDSYRKEYAMNLGTIVNEWMILLGNFLIALILCVLLHFSILFFSPIILEDNRYPFVLLVFTLFALLTFWAISSSDLRLLLIPYTLAVLMFQAFLRAKEYLPIYFVTLFPMLFFAQDGPIYFVMYAITGILVAYVFNRFKKGWRQFVAAFITFVLLSLSYLAFRFTNLTTGELWPTLLTLLMGSLLTVAGYPLVYLFEKLFNLVSDSRLAELSDASNSLIRTLEQKAPGTFQHSIQVMNMTNVVARAIDVDPEIVRVGAMYHDIGKTVNPLCFVENNFLISGDNPINYHTNLSPEQSAHDIIKHVSDGVEIVRKNHLPKFVEDFMLSHHGTTTVRYFYNQYLKNGGDPSRADEFRYKGNKPKTKAQIILMLCDSVEAASRTLKSHTAQAYSDFVEEIVAQKMSEGQFDEADITISELKTVKDTLKQYLAQLNHERVAYPKNKIK